MASVVARIISRIATFLLIVAVIVSVSATAFAANNSGKYPIIRTKVSENYARATLEFLSPNDFILSVNGKTATISFNRKAKINPAKLVAGLSPYIKSVKAKDGVLTINMDKNYKVRSFTAGNISGFDLLGINPQERENRKKSPKQTSQKLLA